MIFSCGLISKLFIETLWVEIMEVITNPIWKRLATSQNRVLRSRSVMAARSVDRKCKGHVIEPRDNVPVWSPCSIRMQGQYMDTVMAWYLSPTGVEEHGIYTSGFLWKMGDPVSSV